MIFLFRFCEPASICLLDHHQFFFITRNRLLQRFRRFRRDKVFALIEALFSARFLQSLTDSNADIKQVRC